MRYILSVFMGLFLISASGVQASSLENYGKVDTQAVDILMNSGLPVIVVDARLPRYDDGQRIPGSVLIPHNASKRTIQGKIPSKDTIIVTYCSNRRCPMAGKLADSLLGMGYRNVLHYPSGLKGWTQAGKPIDHAN